jgi:hypothetical protein
MEVKKKLELLAISHSKFKKNTLTPPVKQERIGI